MELKERLMNCLKFLAVNIGCTMFQFIILIMLVIFQFIFWFCLGLIASSAASWPAETVEIVNYIIWGIVFVIYGMVWFVFWRVLFNSKVRWFYWRVAFAVIPLVAALIMFNPEPNPMAMIPLSVTELKFRFSTIVTGIVLFPLYSIGIHKFVFLKQSKKARIRNSVWICFSMIVIGSLIFFAGWNLMQRIY